MLLSDVISKSTSPVQSHSNGSRLGSSVSMSPSVIVMANLCPAIEKNLFGIFLLGNIMYPKVRSTSVILRKFIKNGLNSQLK